MASSRELVLLRLVGEISLQLLITHIHCNVCSQQHRLRRKCAQRCTSAGGASSGTTYANFSCSRMNFLNKVCVRVKASDAGFVEATGSLPDIRGAATGAGVHRQMCIKCMELQLAVVHGFGTPTPRWSMLLAAKMGHLPRTE